MVVDKKKIVASEYYLKRIGSCSITQITDKKRKLEFDKGKTIEVSEKEFDAIKKLGWGNIPRTKEVKNGD